MLWASVHGIARVFGQKLPMSQDVYQHQETTRRPIVWIGAALSVFMGYVGFAGGAPWYFLFPVGFAFVFSGWFLLLNRISGCRVSSERVETFAYAKTTTYARREINGYKVSEFSEGAPMVFLQKTTGERVLLPGYCLGDDAAFCKALDALGIPRVT
jgi:hypothetical protein